MTALHPQATRTQLSVDWTQLNSPLRRPRQLSQDQTTWRLRAPGAPPWVTEDRPAGLRCDGRSPPRAAPGQKPHAHRKAPASLPAHTSSLLPHGPRPLPGPGPTCRSTQAELLHPPFLKQGDLSLRYGASCVALTCWAQGAWSRTAHVCFGKKFPLPKGPACSRKPRTV